VADTWVVNASPLILLGKIGCLDILPRLCPRIVIPNGVAWELRQGPADDAARNWVQGDGSQWIEAVEHLDPLVAAWDLGRGESDVLTLCRALSEADAIVDDRAARKCAAALGIRVRGTLAVIVLAKNSGLVAEVKPLLTRLLSEGIRIDPALIQLALELANE